MTRRFIRVSAVFASEGHARAAARFLDAWLDAPGRVSLELPDGPSGLAVVTTDVDPANRTGLMTLLRGLHGIPTGEPLEVLAVVA